MYDIIKKQNGEHFAKAIRCYDNGIFDIPNLDRIVKYAGRDAEPIMKYLISLKNIEITKQSEHHEPLELLARAGYDAYIAPKASIQDGWLDVAIVSKFPMVIAPGLALSLFTKNIDDMLHMNTLRTKEITLTRDNEGIAHIDGTPVNMPAQLHVKIVEDGLKVLVKKRF